MMVAGAGPVITITVGGEEWESAMFAGCKEQKINRHAPWPANQRPDLCTAGSKSLIRIAVWPFN